MASRKSAAVSSSHFAESLDCAWSEQVKTRDRSRESRAARFMEFPPEPPCILALFHILEAPFFWFDAEAEDNKNLREEKTDHQAEDAANSIGAEKGDGQEGRENRGATAKGIA